MGSRGSLVHSRGSARAASVARGSRRAATGRWTRASLGVASPIRTRSRFPHRFRTSRTCLTSPRSSPRSTRASTNSLSRSAHSRTGALRCGHRPPPRRQRRSPTTAPRASGHVVSPRRPRPQQRSPLHLPPTRRPSRRCGVERCELRGSQPSSASRRESDPDQAVGRVVDCRAARAVTGGRHLRSQWRRDRRAGRRRLQPRARAAARTRGIRKGPADRNQTLNPVAADHR
jgi:hypothetical protein